MSAKTEEAQRVEREAEFMRLVGKLDVEGKQKLLAFMIALQAAQDGGRKHG